MLPVQVLQVYCAAVLFIPVFDVADVADLVGIQFVQTS